MHQFLFSLMLLMLRYSVAREICFTVNNTCGTAEIYKHSVQYAGNEFIGEKRSIIPNDIVIYDNITHFVAENICDNYTLITGLSKDLYNKEQKRRKDAYTLYGQSGSIMAMATEQTIHITRRLVIHESFNVVNWKTNVNTNLYPDPLTVGVWWDHFYMLLQTNSVVQVKKIGNKIKNTEGESYRLDCKNGKILVIADLSCVYVHELFTSERYKYPLAGVSTETCARKLPKVFSGSVIVKVPQKNKNAKRSCTSMYYICASGEPTARAIHIIKRGLTAPQIANQELDKVSDKEYVFECTCKENDYMTQDQTLSTKCVYKRTDLDYDRLQVLNYEILSIKSLCNKNDRCHYDTSMQDSLRACKCISSNHQVPIELYNNKHGMLKNPLGFQAIHPCKTWLPYNAIDSFVLGPPFRKIKSCGGDDIGNNNYEANSKRNKRSSRNYCTMSAFGFCMRSRSRSRSRRRKGAASAKSVRNMQKNIQKTFKAESEALKRNQKHDNLVSNKVNLNSYRIVDTSSVLEDVILEINSDLSKMEQGMVNIQMQIEMNRIQTVINELNMHNIRTFMVGIHKDRLNLAGDEFKINETTGCVDVPDVPEGIKLHHLTTITSYPSLKPIKSEQFKFTIAPPVNIIAIPHHNYFKSILIIGILLLLFITIMYCACKFMC